MRTAPTDRRQRVIFAWQNDREDRSPHDHPIGNGKPIPPTGKGFKISMATIGQSQDGVMVEEDLLWDHQAFMKHPGLAQ